jgi:fructose-1-phosphate kinase PfkB-like protein
VTVFEIERMHIGSFLKMSATGVASTVVVGLNGALQKRFVLPPKTLLVPGDVHRAIDVQTGVGGKGQDVAVTLSCLQYNGNVQLAQFIGTGPEGDQVDIMLRDLLGDNSMGLTVRPETSGMRTCTSIVASDSTTELVEPSGTILSSEMDELYSKIRSNPNKVMALCFMGSMPPGCPETTYSDIYDIAATESTICVIDTMAGLQPLIKTIAKKQFGSTIFKVNASELCKLAKVSKKNSETAGIHQDELIQAIEQYFCIFPESKIAFDAIAITDGSHPAYLVQHDKKSLDKDTSFQITQLPISSLHEIRSNDNNDESLVLYPIGAGDSVAAGILGAWRFLAEETKNESDCFSERIQEILLERKKNDNNPILTSFAFGLACGSASCLNEGNSIVKQDDVIEIFQRSVIPRIIEPAAA